MDQKHPGENPRSTNPDEFRRHPSLSTCRLRSSLRGRNPWTSAPCLFLRPLARIAVWCCS